MTLQILVDVVAQPVPLQDGEFPHHDVIDQHLEESQHIFQFFRGNARQFPECLLQLPALLLAAAPLEHAFRRRVVDPELTDHQKSGQLVVDENRRNRFPQTGVTLVIDDSPLPDRLLLLVGVERDALPQCSELALNHPAIIAVAHLTAAAQRPPVRGKKRDSDIQYRCKMIQQRLDFVAEKKFKRRHAHHRPRFKSLSLLYLLTA